ncbi:MAG: Tryptophan synthase alpha chain [Bacteroidetes bacterium ADurb.Bin416]|nr:MAG: Tryptophan synthase alpha chain [Bacteroidetes bacterium ADurb.Bin416]
MNPRIRSLFSQKSSRILSVYFTAGYPQKDATMPILKALQEAGVDLVEIGIPFSDPMADGPVIQHSSQLALQNGMSLKVLFDQLESMRPTIHIPVLLMGYVNVIMQYGLEAFCAACRRVGVDGIILPDLPLDEYLQVYKPVMDAHGLSMVLLITPETSDERIRLIDAHTDSFIYMVSSASITGAQSSFGVGKVAYFKRINAMNLKNPRLVGFGISNKATVEAAWEYASGAIIGSRFIECLRTTDTPEAAVECLLEELKR